MDLDHLRVLVAVLESGTFTSAAARLKLSQPAVSQHMAALEKEAGIPLFERSGRLRVPTPAAHELAESGRVAIAALEEADRKAAQLRGLQAGRLVVGATDAPGVHLVPAALGAFAERYPDVQLRMDLASRAELIQRLRERQIDIGIIGELRPEEDIVSTPLAPDRLVPIWGAESPLAAGRVTLERWLQEPFIATEKGSGTREAVERWFLERGSAPSPSMELSTMEAIKSCVARGLGVSVLPEDAVTMELEQGIIMSGRLPGFPLRPRLDVAALRGRRFTNVVDTFLQELLGSKARAFAAAVES
ncbi:MAG TPA: LysR family transcriptional regulator [Actinomycetota bacterium]|nr:LysR family transcriptional regulator [Actinomycetota bacterium]